MKLATFKKEFKNLQEAIEKVPQELKEDMNVFKMTDGNKTYIMRWEGTLEEGTAIPLDFEDKRLNEAQKEKMFHLMGYKSYETIGKSTINENDKFKELISSSKKKINESPEEDIYNPINNAHAEHETSWDRMYNSDEWVDAQRDAEGLDEDMIEEGPLSSLLKAAAIVGISLASFKSLAQQNPQKAMDTLKAKVVNMPDEVKSKIADATGLDFDDATVNRLFPYKEQGKASKLDLGPYGDAGIAKVTRHEQLDNGTVRYFVDIKDRRYLDTDIMNRIKKFNDNLQGAELHFSINGSPLPGKVIKL